MKLETIALHSGYTPDSTKSVAVPIYQTTSYSFDDTQYGADLFALRKPGNIYTRITNPTLSVLEERINALEGGVGAVSFASGAAAITTAVQNLCEVGQNIVSASTLYGGTATLFAHTFRRLGIEVRFADADKPETFKALIDENTRAIYCETIGNPLGNITDIAALAEIAHQNEIPLIVDNTVASPFLCRPFEFGADIVVHSLTKYLGGHGTSLGGIIVDSGNFSWNKKFAMLTEPDITYHGISYAKDCGKAAYAVRARVSILRDTGAALSPFNAFLILQGVENCALRMERTCENAIKVAEFLSKHKNVAWVNYAGLSSNKYHNLAEKYTKGKAAGIMTFGVKSSKLSGKAAGALFQDSLKLIVRLVNIGDSKSLVCHPASTTHSQLSDEELLAAGVSPDMIRLSVGVEHIDDIIADLNQALEALDK